MAEKQPKQTEALEAARRRRIELKSAVSRVEVAASSPAGQANWRSNLAAELELLRAALDQHVSEVEATGGLLNELADAEPRLSGKINKLRDEHPELRRQVDDAIAQANGTTAAEELRHNVVNLLIATVRHRQKGADLVYEVYSVDIGGG